MKRGRERQYHKALLLMCASVLLASGARALCPADNCEADAQTYLVRAHCGTLPNCFESMATLTGSWPWVVAPPTDSTTPPTGCVGCTVGWLWTNRRPTESDPVVIDVGPGTFSPLICPGATGSVPGVTQHGHVVVRGTGRDQTFISAPASNPKERVGIHVNGCEDLVFANLHAEGPTYGVFWFNGGEATWTSVDMASTQNVLGVGQAENRRSYGWYDATGGTERATHFFHDCRASASTKQTNTVEVIGLKSQATEIHFFGGSIVGGPSRQTGISNPLFVFGVYASGDAEFSAYETQIIAKDENLTASTIGVSTSAESRVVLQGASVFARGGPLTSGFNPATVDRVLAVDTAVDATSY